MSFKLGNKGEEFARSVFEKSNIDCEINEDYDKRYDYDLLCEYGRKKFTCEVKYDYMAEKTGNLAIEVNNCRANKPSGINVTKADLWVHIILQDGKKTMWATTVANLKKFIKKTKPLRKVTAAGDGNADLLLYKADEILDPLFVRLDNVHKKTFLKHLKELV
jgi:hypothetical protein